LANQKFNKKNKMFKIIIVLKVIILNTYAEITTADGEVFKLLSESKNYSYYSNIAVFSQKHSSKMCIVYNANYEVIDLMAVEQAGIAKRYKVKGENPQFGFLYLMAGIYTLNMDLPHSKSVLATLKKSEQKQKPVVFYYSNTLQSIYYAEFKKDTSKKSSKKTKKQVEVKKILDKPKNCFSEENFNLVLNYIKAQMENSNYPIYKIQGYDFFASDSSILITKNDTLLSKIEKETGIVVVSIDKAKNDAHTIEINQVFCELVSLANKPPKNTFKVIVIRKAICFTPEPDDEEVLKNGKTNVIYTNDKQYEQYAEITTTGRKVFKLSTKTFGYHKHWLASCLGMALHSGRLGIFYNEKLEIERLARSMVGIISIRGREPNEDGIAKFGILPHAGVYHLDMKTHNAKAILATLQASEKEQKKIRIYLNEFPKGQSVFYVEFEK
jgi:hypothetical protein